jgi:hypothetical protein
LLKKKKQKILKPRPLLDRIVITLFTFVIGTCMS